MKPTPTWDEQGFDKMRGQSTATLNPLNREDFTQESRLRQPWLMAFSPKMQFDYLPKKFSLKESMALHQNHTNSRLVAELR